MCVEPVVAARNVKGDGFDQTSPLRSPLSSMPKKRRPTVITALITAFAGDQKSGPSGAMPAQATT